MRVGILTFSYLPRKSGAVTQAISLAKYLLQRGHHVEIFAPDLEKTGRFKEKEGLVVNRVSSKIATDFDSNISRLVFLAKLCQLVRQNKDQIDVFICLEYHIGSLTLALIRGIRKIGVFGADFVFEFVNYKKFDSIVSYDTVLENKVAGVGFANRVIITLLSKLQGFILENLDRTITVNSIDCTRLQKQFPDYAENIVYVPCGIDKAALKCRSSCEDLVRSKIITGFRELAQDKPRREPLIAVSISRAVSWKKVEEGVSFFLELKKYYPKLIFFYIGCGPLFEWLKGKYEDNPDLHFFTELDHSDTMGLLNLSDIFINLSEYETFSLTNAEAMTLRSLVVTKDLHGYKDYLRDGYNGLIVSPNDHHKVVETVKSLYVTQKVGEILDNAEQTIKSEFSVDCVFNKLEKIMLELIGQGATAVESQSPTMEPTKSLTGHREDI